MRTDFWKAVKLASGLAVVMADELVAVKVDARAFVEDIWKVVMMVFVKAA